MFIFCLAVVSADAYAAGESRFDGFGAIAQRYYGVGQRVPKDYSLENLQGFEIVTVNIGPQQMSNGKEHPCFGYYETAASADGESLVLFPYFPVFMQGLTAYSYDHPKSSFKAAHYQCLRELHSAQGGGIAYGEPLLPESHWAGRIEKLGDKAARLWGDADSVYIVDIPLENAYQSRYSHCVGIYMAKQGRVPLYVKLMLTDRGFADRDKRLKDVRGCMYYTRKPWRYNPEEVSEALKRWNKR